MTSILVVCTGNICRSPIAEGLLRDALVARFGTDAPTVSSAGTFGMEGSGARPESVRAAAERGTDIAGHVAREITGAMVEHATLVVTMAGEHRDAIARSSLDTEHKTFTLKELVRLLESLPPVEPGLAPDALGARVADAEAKRETGFAGNPHDLDVADPLGMPIDSYRAIAWELDEWIGRLVDGLYGALVKAVEP